MKCPICGNENAEGSVFCSNCGANMTVAQQPAQQSQQPQQPQGPYYAPAPYVDPYDHTNEFDAQDISQNKVFALCSYLFGMMGIIVALLASNDSKFTKFHVRNALKLTVLETLLVIIGLVLCWTFIVPILAGIALSVLAVIEIICFVQACQGKAKDPAIVRSMGFLK